MLIDFQTREPIAPFGHHVANFHLQQPASGSLLRPLHRGDVARYAAAVFQPSSLVEHAHEVFQVAVLLRATKARYRSVGACGSTGSVEVRGGDIVVVPPHQPHTFELERSGGMVNLYFGAEDLAHFDERLGSFPHAQAPEMSIRSSAVLLDFARALHANARLSAGRTQERLDALWIRFAEHLVEEGWTRDSRDGRTGVNGRLDRAIDFMHAHADQPIRQTQLAHLACYSPAQFRRALRARYGVGPLAYLAELRIARAQSLLREAELPLEVIAQRSGFANPSYFATTVRAKTGISPSRFRRALRRGPR